MNIYCGNNANHTGLLERTQILGSRYSCLQKGKTNGYSQPVDPNFLRPYRPIDTTKKYCGNSSILPDGYNRFGGLYECYLTGMGVGKKLKAQNSRPELSQHSSEEYSDHYDLNDHNSNNSDIKYNNDDIKQNYKDIKQNSELDNSYIENIQKTPKYVVGILIYILGITAFFIGMYYGKPSIIIKDIKDENIDKIIDWSKFVPYLFSFSVIFAVLVYFFIKYLFK
jgi:hypothetical protein